MTLRGIRCIPFLAFLAVGIGLVATSATAEEANDCWISGSNGYCQRPDPHWDYAWGETDDRGCYWHGIAAAATREPPLYANRLSVRPALCPTVEFSGRSSVRFYLSP
jgi:hypothetical protein